MSITANLVKELRDLTGAGMMECKKALLSTNGDIALAVEELRKKGLSVAGKKSGRITPEGLIGVAVKDTCGAVVEVNTETDFVARNAIFQDFVAEVAAIAIKTDQKDIADSIMNNGKTVKETLTHNVATIGEHQSFRRAAQLSVPQGVVASYVHGVLREGLGTIGVLIGLEVEQDDSSQQGKAPDNTAALKTLGKQLAMHIASVNPRFLSEIPSSVMETEREILTQQALKEGKPANIVEKIIAGRLQKFKQENIFEQQIFVIDGETKILDVVQNTAKKLGLKIKITGFVRYELGEGIEKKQENFAQEVAETMGK